MPESPPSTSKPHYFGGLINRVDLVIDHHPTRAGYSAAFKDIRPDYGSTCTILTEHLRAVDANISERTATAMLYAIKSDTLFLSRHTDESDLDAFRFLYPLANAALVRKMEGSETNLERLACLSRAMQCSEISGSLYTSHLGEVAREDLITFAADFLLQVEEVSFSVVSGIVQRNVVISARNLGDSADAGKFVRQSFGDIGSAGGHRVMAKAVAPIERFAQKFGPAEPDRVLAVTHALADAFLHTPLPAERRRGADAPRRGRTTGVSREACGGRRGGFGKAPRPALPGHANGDTGVGGRGRGVGSISSPLGAITGLTNCRYPSSKPRSMRSVRVHARSELSS